jgi:hypothetical protein
LLATALNTGQIKKKVTLSHVYNEVTIEPTSLDFHSGNGGLRNEN